MRKLLVITYLFASLSIFASQISGIAPSYVGKTLVLSTTHDGWGATKEILDSCKVAEDGSFTLQVNADQTIQAQLDLGYYTGIIYIAKGQNYSINLPYRKEISRKDKLNPYFKPQTILLSFNNLPVDDINRKIADFEDTFDSVWVDITQNIVTTEKIDAAMNTLDENIKIPHWLDYNKCTAVRFESREKLKKHQPENLAQALRIPGVNPADISILAIIIKRGHH